MLRGFLHKKQRQGKKRNLGVVGIYLAGLAAGLFFGSIFVFRDVTSTNESYHSFTLVCELIRNQRDEDRIC